jgi:primosomal protein N'
MIAHIYPFTRLPRKFGFFDYKIPEGMTIGVGDLVRIPLRQRTLFGVVSSLSETSTFPRLSSIEECIAPSFLSEGDLKRFEILAEELFLSPANLFQFVFRDYRIDAPSPSIITQEKTSLSLSSDDATRLQAFAASLEASTPSLLECSAANEAALCYLLRKKYKKQILIICPRANIAESLTQRLPLLRAVCLTGSTKPKERAAIISAWRRGDIDTLITTRQGALLPAKALNLVIVLDSGSDDYSLKNRNPRFDARLAARLQALQHNIPYLETARLAAPEHLQKPWSYTAQDRSDIQLTDLSDTSTYSDIPLIRAPLLARISEALDASQRILLIHNQKGFAKRLECLACHAIPTCRCGEVPDIRIKDLRCNHCGEEMWIPNTCPTCGADRLKQKGVGSSRLMELLQKVLPSARISLHDKEHIELASSDIVISTEYFFKSTHHNFFPRIFSLIADLSFDANFISLDYNAMHGAAERLSRLTALQYDQRANYLVQTWVPDKLRALSGKSYLNDELTIREKYKLPPFKRRLRLIDKNVSSAYKDTLTKLKERGFDLRMIDDVRSEMFYEDASISSLAPLFNSLPDQVIIETDLPTYAFTSRRYASK